MRARVGLLALLAAVAACDGDAPPPTAVRLPPAAVSDPTLLRISGTGAMTPLMARIVAVWQARGGQPRIWLGESIGSGGSVRAVVDGAIDVGMIARPLSAAERQHGLTVIPVARDVVVVAAHPSVAATRLTSAQLIDLWAARSRKLPDGSPAVVLLRDPDESANAALEEAVPGLKSARERSQDAGSLRVLYHDDAMGEALASTRGAIGVFSLGAACAARQPLGVISVDGVAPSAETVASGEWRAWRTLSLVVRPERLALARPLLEFLDSPDGRSLVQVGGYLLP